MPESRLTLTSRAGHQDGHVADAGVDRVLIRLRSPTSTWTGRAHVADAAVVTAWTGSALVGR